MPKVSIIVPVYKAEKYISRCVESILAQTYKDWELLLVDDGSPDNSGNICDSYAAKDDRVVVLHKENGGVSSARNLALDHVSGDWVTFVDADDYIVNTTIQICVDKILRNNLDIIQFSYYRHDIDLNNKDNRVETIKGKILYIKDNDVLPCIWGTIIKKEIINNNRIRFNEKIKLGEDQLFLYECIWNSSRLLRIYEPLYFYFYNENSASNNEKCKDLINASYHCIKFKEKFSLFASRIDDLVLYYIERLILQGDNSNAMKLLQELKPVHTIYRPWCTRLMITIAKINVRYALLFERIVYPIHYRFIRSLVIIKNRINNGRF